jgi:hypothetical protein
MRAFKSTAAIWLAVTGIAVGGGDIAPAPQPTAMLEATAASPWHIDVQLYAMTLWIQGESAMGYRTRFGENSFENVDIDMTPKTIIDHLKMGAMAHIEAHHDNGWGVWLDYAFMNLSKDVGDSADVELGLFEGIFEGFATFRRPMYGGTLQYFGGVRWYHFKVEMDTARNDYKRTFDWYDPVIGAAWVSPINEKWHYRLRADIGGFGVGSDFSAALEAGLLYDIAEKWQVDMRIKSLWVDYDDGTPGNYDRFEYDTVSFGPIVGITYRF